MKKKIRFIINPISGVGRKKKLPQLIAQNIDATRFEYSITYTEYRGHAKEISAQAAAEGIDILCIVGGDGSVNEAGSALLHKETILAILPSGSGNGIARHLGIPMNLKKAIERINKMEVKSMDTVEINGNPAIGVSGFGFDAKVAKKFDEYKSRGLMSYARIVIAEFRAYKGISAVINNNLRYTNLLFCCIANTSQFGNNFYISQNSKIDDGEIEVVLIKTPPFYALLKLLTLSLRRKPYTSKYVNVIRVKNIEIQLENNLGHIDGDPIVYSESTLKIQCIPKSLNVII